MKVQELFEAVKLPAEIVLGSRYDITNSKIPSKDALAAAEKKAKAKFKELKAAHATKLKFATTPEAQDYMKSIDDIGWPLEVWGPRGSAKVRKATVDFSDWVEPAAADIQVEDLGDGTVKISTTAKTGPLLNVIRSVVWNAYDAKKAINGQVYKQFAGPLERFRSNKAIITATKTEVEKFLAKATKMHDEQAADKAQREKDKNDPVKKKEANQLKYQQQKERKQELYDKYGKDIVDSVKIRSLIQDGDDGYQWSLWVDGQKRKSGMTQYQAEGEQRMMWAYLLKVSKMSPEELKKEADIAAGWKAYLMYNALERGASEYINAVNKNAKDFVDAKDKSKSVIDKAKHGTDGKEEYKALMAKLQKKI